MDTQRLNWMHIGQLIRVNGRAWYGEIVDVAETDAGKVMLQINSPKAAWHGHVPEWLEYIPDQIVPATIEEAQRDIELYLDRLERAKDEIQKLGARWAALDTVLHRP